MPDDPLHKTTPGPVYIVTDRGRGDEATVKVAYRREGDRIVIVAEQTIPARANVVWPAGGEP